MSNENLLLINELNKHNVITKLNKPISYFNKKYNISSEFTGQNIKILIIDSGLPTHSDIPLAIDSVSFSDNSNIEDTTGHSTIVSGIISSKNKNNIMGLAPDSLLLHAKVVNKNNSTSYNALISAILWGIVKEVDIITIAMGSKFNYPLLHDVIKKAYKNNIFIVSSAGNVLRSNSDIMYPAKYKEVISVGNTTNKNINTQISLKKEKKYSTYLNNQFIQVSGSSVSTAITTGVLANLCEKYKKTPGKYDKITKELKNIFPK